MPIVRDAPGFRRNKQTTTTVARLSATKWALAATGGFNEKGPPHIAARHPRGAEILVKAREGLSGIESRTARDHQQA